MYATFFYAALALLQLAYGLATLLGAMVPQPHASSKSAQDMQPIQNGKVDTNQETMRMSNKVTSYP